MIGTIAGRIIEDNRGAGHCVGKGPTGST